jgi:hypothetical protein
MSHDPARTTNNINSERIDSEFFRNKLKLKHLEVKKDFEKSYPHVVNFFKDRGSDFAQIRNHSAKVLTSTALTGMLLLTPPGLNLSDKMPDPAEIVRSINSMAGVETDSDSVPKNQLLTQKIKEVLPLRIMPLNRVQEKNIEKIISEMTGIKAKANLEGEHLNTTYGLIGAEQHLKRFPGDTISQHDLMPDDEGIAPGLGGFGYFAKSKSLLTKEDIEREKWYAVVQTLYLPDWNTRLRFLVKWYKYRKVLIVNTVNGNAVVADIADSGPAAFTGKHFGGSPEVMNYLGGSRYKKGPVVLFFVDDPENKVPLGPVEYNNSNIPESMLTKI